MESFASTTHGKELQARIRSLVLWNQCKVRAIGGKCQALLNRIPVPQVARVLLDAGVMSAFPAGFSACFGFAFESWYLRVDVRVHFTTAYPTNSRCTASVLFCKNILRGRIGQDVKDRLVRQPYLWYCTFRCNSIQLGPRKVTAPTSEATTNISRLIPACFSDISSAIAVFTNGHLYQLIPRLSALPRHAMLGDSWQNHRFDSSSLSSGVASLRASL